jgi:hypothetical protein
LFERQRMQEHHRHTGQRPVLTLDGRCGRVKY